MTNNHQNETGSTSPAKERTILELLRDWLMKSSCRIYTVTRYRSSFGKTVYLDAYVINDFHPIRITRHVAAVTGFTYSDDYGALKMHTINENERPSDTVAFALQKSLPHFVFREAGPEFLLIPMKSGHVALLNATRAGIIYPPSGSPMLSHRQDSPLVPRGSITATRSPDRVAFDLV